MWNKDPLELGQYCPCGWGIHAFACEEVVREKERKRVEEWDRRADANRERNKEVEDLKKRIRDLENRG